MTYTCDKNFTKFTVSVEEIRMSQHEKTKFRNGWPCSYEPLHERFDRACAIDDHGFCWESSHLVEHVVLGINPNFRSKSFRFRGDTEIRLRAPKTLFGPFSRHITAVFLRYLLTDIQESPEIFTTATFWHGEHNHATRSWPLWNKRVLVLRFHDRWGPPKLVGVLPISVIDFAEIFSEDTPSLVLPADANKSLGYRNFLLRPIPREPQPARKDSAHSVFSDFPRSDNCDRGKCFVHFGASRLKKYRTVRFLERFYWKHYEMTQNSLSRSTIFDASENQQSINRSSWDFSYTNTWLSSTCAMNLGSISWAVGVLWLAQFRKNEIFGQLLLFISWD